MAEIRSSVGAALCESPALAEVRDAPLPSLMDGGLCVKGAERLAGGVLWLLKFVCKNCSGIFGGEGMDRVAELILNRVALITPALDEAMAAAIEQAERRAMGFEHRRFPHTRPLNIRQDVRLALEEQPLPDGWEIDGDPRKMGQLLLVDRRTGMTVRFLKAPYSQPDRIPHAGQNPARRGAWTNRSLQSALPSLGREGALAHVSGLKDETFLLIWAYVNPDERTDGYDLRIVHTREPGAFGKATRCDLDLTIPRGGHINQDNLRFVSSEEDEDLFFDIPGESDEDSEGEIGEA